MIRKHGGDGRVGEAWPAVISIHNVAYQGEDGRGLFYGTRA